MNLPNPKTAVLLSSVMLSLGCWKSEACGINFALLDIYPTRAHIQATYSGCTCGTPGVWQVTPPASVGVLADVDGDNPEVAFVSSGGTRHETTITVTKCGVTASMTVNWPGSMGKEEK